MAYLALYRQWRPQNFDALVGQQAVKTALKNALDSGRIAHAYLFSGPRGTGKTSTARILAKALNCEQGPTAEPCGHCHNCERITAGTSMDVLEIDAASNGGIDQIKELKEQIAFTPVESRYKVYIIDEVHMLSAGAFNALLKTLEEPPSYVIFILATTESHKIPVTIQSRCQRYDFHRISIDTIAGRLRELMEKEQIPVEEKALRYVAKAGDGSMRDALSLLDQCIAFYLGQELTFDKVLEVLGTVDTEVFSKLLRKVLEQDVTSCIHILEDLLVNGKELGQFVNDFTWYLRNLLLVKTSEDAEEVLDVSSENLKALQEESQLIDTDTLMRYIRVLSELSNNLRNATQKRVLVEVGLIKLCKPAMETNLDSVLDRLRVLEEQMEKGIPMTAVQPLPGYAGMNNGIPPQPTRWKREQPTQAVPSAPEKKPEKAAPEDLQRIKENWKNIVMQTQGMFKTFLTTAVPKYNGNTGENKLYVEFSNDLAQTCVDDPDKKKLLEGLILQMTGKTVEVEMLLKKTNMHQDLAEISVDDILKQTVHMDIVVEEEPEDE